MRRAIHRLADGPGARGAEAVIAGLSFAADATLAGRVRTIQLPFRQATAEEVAGAVHGAQRFVDASAYDRHIPALLERIARLRTQPAEVQALLVRPAGGRAWAFVGIPAEFFAENGLKIKEHAGDCRALVVSCANGMLGYVPHAAAFSRRGYETTFAPWSRLAQQAGDLLADCALELLRRA